MDLSSRDRGLARVACLGDSITAGSDDGTPAPYPALLQVALGKGFRVKNFGVAGATLWHGGQPNSFEQLPAATAFAPHVAVVNFGINDTRSRGVDYWNHFPEFVLDATRMLDALLAQPVRPSVLLCLPIANFADLPGMDADRRENVAERLPRLVRVREALRGVVAAYADRGVALVDLHAITQSRPEIFAVDGVHLLAAGQRLLATTLQPHVAALAASFLPV